MKADKEDRSNGDPAPVPATEICGFDYHNDSTWNYGDMHKRSTSRD